MELEIIYLPYDVHYILSLLEEYLNYDTSALSQTEMQEYLVAIDWDNFVLDQHAIESFFDDFGIDYSSFN